MTKQLTLSPPRRASHEMPIRINEIGNKGEPVMSVWATSACEAFNALVVLWIADTRSAGSGSATGRGTRPSGPRSAAGPVRPPASMPAAPALVVVRSASRAIPVGRW